MANRSIGERINDLIDREKWPAARALIRTALRREPDSHWLLTQLGSVHYEERHYDKAFAWLARSKEIVADCPLTMWHMAGTLDALGHHESALRLFSWILTSKKTPEDDPCWESTEWTDALKTDCVYRIAICYRNLSDSAKAAQGFREYMQLRAVGMPGSYSIDEAARLASLLKPGDSATRHSELRKAVKAMAPANGDRRADIIALSSQELLQLQS